MILLIDAYNVLKQRTGAKYISLKQQEGFVGNLFDYAQKKGHRIVIIFDGGDSRWPYEQKKGNVTIVYSGETTNADELLKRSIDSAQSPQDTLLVSSDRELVTYAKKRGIASIDSGSFSEVLQEKHGSRPTVFKSLSQSRKQHENDKEVDNLMEKASQVIMLKEDDLNQETPLKRGKEHTMMSKREKKLTRMVKKL